MTNYIHQGNKITLNWTVKKGAGLALEDFSRAAVRLFFINATDRIYVPCTISGIGVITATATTENVTRWPEGTYSVELLWVKNMGVAESRCLQRTRVDNLFCLTANESEADSGQAPVTLTLTTVAHSYGYDGLSAYEAAVLRGYAGSETDYYNETLAYEVVNEEDGYEVFDDGKLRLVKATADSDTFINAYLGNKQISLKAIPQEVLTLLDEIAANGVNVGMLGADVLQLINDAALPEATRALVDEMAAKGVSLEMLTPELQRMLSKAVPVSLEVLNEALGRVWDKIEDMTGEVLHGIQMSVSPTYFVGEDGADVHITASSRNSGEKFDQIAFYANDELVVKEKNTDYLEFDFHITEDTDVKCEAYLLGRKYTQEKTITKYSAFWMGSGDNYQEVMVRENLVPKAPRTLPSDLRFSEDVTVAEDGQYIILIMGSSLSEGFIRADMNGFEIPFEAEDITVDNKSYKVYKSLNTYQAGTYNIDING